MKKYQYILVFVSVFLLIGFLSYRWLDNGQRYYKKICVGENTFAIEKGSYITSIYFGLPIIHRAYVIWLPSKDNTNDFRRLQSYKIQ